MTDVTILTDQRYFLPKKITPYIQNILDEYEYLKKALEDMGFSVARTYWDNPDYNWSQTRAVVFRTVWDYFERIDEFREWLVKVNSETKLINPLKLVEWNIDKHYLADLQRKEIDIVPTVFVDSGSYRSLEDVSEETAWEHLVIKPAVSGAAFHTYKVMNDDILNKEALFKQLVSERDMLVQPFISTIPERGEASLMVFNGAYTHAILKKAKTGDFRVQDDFGGTVHHYDPTPEEITFAMEVFKACEELPAYGRADIVWDENGNHLLSELEIIEPELWIRNHPPAAVPFAEGIRRILES